MGLTPDAISDSFIITPSICQVTGNLLIFSLRSMMCFLSWPDSLIIVFFFFPLSGLLDHVDHNPGFSGPTWILFPSAFSLLFNYLEQAPSPL